MSKTPKKVIDFLPSAIEAAITQISDLQQRWHALYPLHAMLISQPQYARQLYEALHGTIVGFEPFKRDAVINLLDHMFAPYGIEVSADGIYEDVPPHETPNPSDSKVIPFPPSPKNEKD